MIKYWLFKSEPEAYSIDKLKDDCRTWWTGIRNYQARNFMTQDMTIGDQIIFYHSNAKPSGAAGIARVCRFAEPDPTQFNKKSDFYDPKSTDKNPRWSCVQVEFMEKFPQVLPLSEIRKITTLKNMLLLQPGQRLSIQPVKKAEFDRLCNEARKKQK